MKQFKFFLLVMLFVLEISYADENLAKKDINKSILKAQEYVIKALSNRNLELENLSPSQLLIFNKYRTQFLSEMTNLNLRLLDSHSSPFIHFGQETWFETDIKDFGEIRIRSLEAIQNAKESGPLFFIRFLGHEIGHHLLSNMGDELTPEIESLASRIATTFEKVVIAQTKTPGLLALAPIKLMGTKEGCHDSTTIKNIDPFSGLITLVFATSTDHCRVAADYMQGKIPKSEMYIYDTIEMTLKCTETDENGLLCFDTNPSKLFNICSDYVNHVNGKIQQVSGIQIEKDFSIKTGIAWCVSDYKKAVNIFDEYQVYSKNSKPMALTFKERMRNYELQSNMTGLMMILKTDVNMNEVHLNEVNEDN